MSSVERTTTVAAAPPDVLAVVTAVEAYPDWEREVRSVEVHDRDDRGRPLSTTLRVGTGKLGGYYTVAWSYPDASTVTYRLTDSDIMSRHDARFVATPAGGGSEFAVRMDLELRVRMPRLLLDRWVGRSVANLVDTVRERAERRD